MKHILVLGGGSIGKRHARNLISLGEKGVAIVEVNADRIQPLKDEFGIPVYPSMEEAFEAESFDIAFVCSPSLYHMEQALYCADKGCHLFIEKPVSHSLEGMDQLIAVAKEKNLITMVGSNWKFYPLFIKMKELIDAGTIGKILTARCQFGQYLPDWHPWEDYKQGYSANKKLGGGILLDSHEFDYLTWFVGPVKQLACFADTVSDLDIDVEDVAATILRFENGAIGEIHLDYLQRFYQRNFEFVGEKGTILWSMPEKKIILKTKEHDEEEFPLVEDYDINDMYVEEARHFLEAVDARTQTKTPLASGAAVVRLIVAAKESNETGRFISISYV
ncbi:MAG: hypothetical protein COU35_03860 [Candidatus Magasanikbacteria bacterium CG10_big_fil_rev_8_21_14_0_10_47_10]|uniref:Gfo/Idh/MocA family oxidoreductase n=1 Tax=Candidatus Magasanikbacteria bacterium CG10_big_fil_rev_8_21_14_0_10_47_10 TaxID=1974652 RepID=A0A2H0TRM0_9BACT|nr:MAG: hypothetical protein COU35_03860 [Candidatus Magasanikbacteria bacterium CG10_big_fil_rev_8_21_14_0_10_47_10]